MQENQSSGETKNTFIHTIKTKIYRTYNIFMPLSDESVELHLLNNT